MGRQYKKTYERTDEKAMNQPNGNKIKKARNKEKENLKKEKEKKEPTKNEKEIKERKKKERKIIIFQYEILCAMKMDLRHLLCISTSFRCCAHPKAVLYVHSLMSYKGFTCNNKSLIQIKDL